jgi:hypothetical protein
MNCKEAHQAIGFHHSGRMSEDIMRHAETCRECRASLAAERVTVSLLSLQQASDMEPSPFCSWEAAIVGLRGWITALGAVAVLVIAVSVEWSRPSIPETYVRVDHETQDVDTNSVEELIGSASDAPRKTTSNLYE